MLHKNNTNAISFVENPQEDEFLQNNIITPLGNIANINFIYSSIPQNLNIYSFEDLKNFIGTLSTTPTTNSNKK